MFHSETKDKPSYQARLGNELRQGVTYQTFKSQAQITGDKEEYVDYCEHGICEVMGLRYPRQEDIVKINTVDPVFFSFDAVKQRNILLNTFDSLQKKYGQYKYGGSTANFIVTWLNKGKLYIKMAYLGDSTAFLVILDEKGSVQWSELLNKNLHSTSIKLGGRLSLTHAFGDVGYEEFGLSHVPEIIEMTLKVAPKNQVFILNACDGLTEGGGLAEKTIGEIVSQHGADSLDETAFQLVKAAYNGGSSDNITVVCQRLLPDALPASSLILDGHGGDAVAKIIGEHFYATLDHFIQSLT